MKITKSTYKDIFALRLEGEKYIALVLPDQGAKIASFYDKARGKEYLLQNPSERYTPLGPCGEFEKCECSGFDDMFPTIDPCIVDGESYPDHGEVARVPFSYEIADNCLTLSFTSKLGYRFEKRVCEDAEGRLCINYKLENKKSAPLRALFATHCLVRIENGGRIRTPFSSSDSIDLVYDTEREGARVCFEPEMLKTVWSDRREARKWYFPDRVSDGAVAYEYPSGERFVMEYDKESLPYLGIWLDLGKINGTYSVGIEPCSLGYDTVHNAAMHGQLGAIDEALEFTVKLYIE